MSDEAMNAANSQSSCCSPKAEPQRRFNWQIKWQKLFSPWLATFVIPLLVALFDHAQFGEFWRIASQAFLGTLPFIMVAVSLVAFLKAANAETLVAKVFSGRENRMIVFAALFGGLAPFCSCEVIPFVAGLLALGTPLPAVMAFWLSSPLIDPASILITAGALGWPFAIAKALGAILLGLMGGFALKLMLGHSSFSNPLKKAQQTSCCGGSATKQSQSVQWAFWRSREGAKTFKSEAQENFIFLVKWLMFAYALEALLILYIPAEAIVQVVGGDGFGSVIVGAAVGMPAYLNSFAAPALVSGLVEQGMNLGAAMAFMMAGAISSIPAMTAVYSLVKRPVFFSYLLLGFSGAVLFGAGFGMVASYFMN